MGSVKKLVIVPADEWSRIIKDNNGVMTECVKEIEWGTSPPTHTTSSSSPREEEKVVCVENVHPTPPAPQEGGEGEGQAGKDLSQKEPTSKVERRRWGPPGRPLHPSKRRKWIHL